MNALITRSAVALTVAAALIGYSVQARADRIDGTAAAVPAITVSYRELDISKPSGLEVLYTRIEHAARTVCRFEQFPQERSRARIAGKCYQATVDNAVRQINQPMLTALHRTRNKQAVG